jgi:nitroimidazol reductase NimA-like FMN-containing flavoprotein (pyridoxamine 5'-phosphate oxidase superfamily)
MIETLNDRHIEDVLQKNVVGRIGCCIEGRAYIVPISYAYDGQYVYAHTTEGMKVNIMRKNPHVCFEVDNTKNMAEWQSIIAWGDFEELTDTEERNKALQLLTGRVLPFNSGITTHLGSEWPFNSHDYRDIGGIVFRIHLKEKTGRFESNALSPAFTV